MTEFNGRRAPNFSQYLEDLNAIPSPYDQALQQQQQQQDVFNVDADLSLFTNTEFFDFDKFGSFDLPAFDAVEDGNPKKANKAENAQSSDIDFLNLLDGLGNNMPDYSAQEFNQVNTQSSVQQHAPFPEPPSVTESVITHNAPSQSLSSNPSPASTTSSQAPTPKVANSSPAPTPAPAPKRKNTQKTPVMTVEEASLHAAEEDKRRRNTAASARFRVKKKMREQALEKTVKETTDKNNALEVRVTALELENQWLKNLITEKNGNSEEDKTSEHDIAGMFKKFLASQKASVQESNSDFESGVGTA
ncbi:hypothetical protein P168DRAFT_131643 [Aspergillus campestris IBT 28561]|uniref:BZIP domain-containing protein n=1 Tax=Aspergillus campestris (strain IBT 28561) TaxID=1392248 RepID=A0A2I1D7K2_ASPC2|nr:uncharacterized protein P168DRAFT_131643 [Aspergillus campestris IBT 28561]PKY05862.1 hypothetical protein P168DRAFT_131643 [Aspergillus campestris IBT 28561]